MTETVAPESNLIAHARRELTLIGEDPDVVEWFLRVVREFTTMGHSGGSAEVCANVLDRLLRYKPLSPLTDDPAEWENRAEIMGEPWWQNLRDSRAMSKDGGQTYWLVTEQTGDLAVTPMYRSERKVEVTR